MVFCKQIVKGLGNINTTEHGLYTMGKEQPSKVSKEGVPLDPLEGYCDNTGIVI